MIKKITSVLLCLTLTFICVFADDNVIDEIAYESSSSTVVYTLSLNDAISMAVTDNPQLKACEAKQNNNRIQLDSAKYSEHSYSKTRTVSVSSGYEVTYVKGGYYVFACEEAIKLCDKEYEQIKSKIAYDVTEKYFNYKSVLKLVELTEKSFGLVAENYNNAKLSYDLGLISKYELDNAELSVKQLKYNLENLKNSCELAKDSLKISLNKNNVDCDFILTDNVTTELFTTNLQEDLELAKQNRYDINGLKSNYLMAKKYFELTTVPNTSAKYNSALSSYITAEYNYNNNSALILLGVKSAYNNIFATNNALDIKDSTLNLKKSNYEIAKVKYEQGLITNTELTTALNDVAQAEIDLENAKLSYKLAVEKYKYEINIGL